MLRIKVHNFSCIKDADLCFGRLTILIGPQASGKSVLSKLAYFFIEMLTAQYDKITEQKSFEEFSEDLKTKFSEWFPVAAWGKEKFKIEFEMGEYKVRITRTSYDDSIRNNLRFWASNLAKDHYKESAELIKTFRQKSTRRNQAHFIDLELGWQLRDAAIKNLHEAIGEDFVENQTFIPAGRSFFTTLGRAFMAFDQARTMDPITHQFGRFYAGLQDHFRWIYSRQQKNKLDAELTAMLGGSVIWEGDRPMLKSADGRVVPFSALSSGQQELIPLMLTLSIAGVSETVNRYGPHLLYIEEPEAHLFPSAQSKLLQALAALISNSASKRRLLLTTHSPYVLSKINNLIKAGTIAEKMTASKRTKLDSIVPASSRLPSGTVKAYAIADGVLTSIIDNDGLIAADYLDSISCEIGEEFSELLDLEFGQ